MRWPHFNFADFDCGISSDRQVKHVTSLSGSSCCGAGVNHQLPRKLDRLCVELEIDGATLAERIELVVLLLLGNGRELDGGYLVEALLFGREGGASATESRRER